MLRLVMRHAFAQTKQHTGVMEALRQRLARLIVRSMPFPGIFARRPKP